MHKYINDQVYEKLLEERIIFLNEEINNKIAGEIVSQLLYLDSINNDDITIYINSPGGSITSGLMIYDTIKYLKSDVSTVGIGLSASMAAILLASGTKGKRKILPHGKVMLHDLSAGTSGKYNDIMIEVEELKKTHMTILNIVLNNTKLSKEEIETYLKNDFWLNSKEALKYGIVDNIIGSD